MFGRLLTRSFSKNKLHGDRVQQDALLTVEG